MVDEEQYSNDLSTRLDICFPKPLQILANGREDDLEDINNDDICKEMNK